MIAFLFTVPEEIRPFRKRLQKPSVSYLEGFPLWRGWLHQREILVILTGHGARKATQAAQSLLSGPRPSFWVITGFAGALTETARPGDLIIADSVCTSDTLGRRTPEKILRPSAEGIRATGRIRPRDPLDFHIHYGRLLTVNSVIQGVEERSRLREMTGAFAVDMETYPIADLCEAEGIPWFAIRAFTDGPEEEFPLELGPYLTPEGEVRRRALVLSCLTHPHRLKSLVRLARDSRRAAQNLADFLYAWAQVVPEY
jgi:adenosylhomocysteine nucleosidase